MREHEALVFLDLAFLGIIFFRSLLLPPKFMISFSLQLNKFPVVYMVHIVIVLSSVTVHVGCFHFLAIVNRAAMNTADNVCGVGYQVLQAISQEWHG